MAKCRTNLTCVQRSAEKQNIEGKWEACHPKYQVIGSYAVSSCKPDDCSLAVPSTFMKRMTKAWLCHQVLMSANGNSARSVQSQQLRSDSRGILSQTGRTFVQCSSPKKDQTGYYSTRSKIRNINSSRLNIATVIHKQYDYGGNELERA